MKAAEVMITNVITVVDKALAQLQAEASLINVIVQDGTVELWGIVGSASEKKTVRVAAEGSPSRCAPSMTISLFVRRKRGTDADDFDLRQRPAVPNSYSLIYPS
jgi:hypothetical protein